MQPKELIAKTGIDRIAEGIGLKPNAVKQWKVRNAIPPKHWPKISTAFPDLTIEKLVAIDDQAVKPKPVPRRKAA